MKAFSRIILIFFVYIIFLSVFVAIFWISLSEIASKQTRVDNDDESLYDSNQIPTTDNSDLVRSRFRSKEYHCYGTCFCDEDSSDQRRISISRGVSTLLFAVSIVSAFRIAENQFDVDCLSMLEDECATSISISSEVGDCLSSEFDDSNEMSETMSLTKSNDDSRGGGESLEECYDDFESVGGEDHHYDPNSQYKLISWNINGMNAFSQKKAVGFGLGENTWAEELVERENPTMILLQEIRLASESQISKYTNLFPGYTGFFHISKRKGYSGTAVFVRNDGNPLERDPRFGMNIQKHDGEGRTITSELPEFYVVNNYVPNSGDGFKRLDYRIEEWDVDLQNYLLDLQKKKSIIWSGDLNTAILDIDVHNPKTQKSAGFHPRERNSFGRFLKDNDFVDTFRYYHPDKMHCYSYWGYRFKLREKNKGWRLDYFVVSKDLQDKLVDSYILPQYMGSDHCPIGLIINK